MKSRKGKEMKKVSLLSMATLLLFSVTMPSIAYMEDAPINNATPMEDSVAVANEEGTSGGAATKQEKATTFKVPAKAAIAIDSQTGQILYAQNSQQVLPIASMTKMISCAVILDAIQDGTLSWNDKVTIDDKLAALSVNPDLSNVPLIAGQSYSVRDLFNATIIQSANAAVMALANKVAGNQEKFVQLMKQKVEQWGIKDAHLITVSGLNNKYLEGFRLKGTKPTDENKMSAEDMAIVSQHIVNDYPDYLKVSKQSTVVFAKGTKSETEMTNWNEMVAGQPVYTPGVDGLKTGTTEEAGACFAGTINKNHWRIVTVVMNVEGGVDNKPARFEATRDLMNYVYNHYEKKTIIKKGQDIKGLTTLHVAEGKKTELPIVSAQDVTAIVEKNKAVDYQVKQVNKKEVLPPVKKDEVVAQYQVNVKGSLGDIDQKTTTYKAMAKEDDAKANLFVLLGRKVKAFIHDLF